MKNWMILAALVLGLVAAGCSGDNKEGDKATKSDFVAEPGAKAGQ